jgi:DNA-binding GntR family transcriptional regulator
MGERRLTNEPGMVGYGSRKDRAVNNGPPQYARIAADLRDKIKDGTYGPGALLPSRNEIIAEYGVSAITARDALSVISHEGYARAIRGRGHVVRRKRSRMTLPGQIYATSTPDPQVPLELCRLDVYQEPPPDNIALPLESSADSVWVRRAVYRAVDDRQPVQIHVSWLLELSDQAEAMIRGADPRGFWPDAVQAITGRSIATVRQLSRTRRANPFEADAFGIPDGTPVFVAHLTTYDQGQRPIEHSRYTWPTDAVRVSECYPYPGGSAPD